VIKGVHTRLRADSALGAKRRGGGCGGLSRKHTIQIHGHAGKKEANEGVPRGRHEDTAVAVEKKGCRRDDSRREVASVSEASNPIYRTKRWGGRRGGDSEENKKKVLEKARAT